MHNKKRLGRCWRGFAALLFLALSVLPPSQPVFAQEPGAEPAPQPQAAVADAPEGGLIRWTTAGATTLDAVRSALPASEFQGFTLPIQTFAFRVTGGPEAGELVIRQLQAVDLPPGSIAPNPPPEALVVDASTVLHPEVIPPQLPTAPAFVLSSGTVSGEWIVVVGLSPVFTENGVVKLATAVEALVTGAVRAPSVEELSAQAAASASLDPEALSAAPEAFVDPALVAAPDALDNLDAGSAFLKIVVAAPGIQRMPLATLAAANAAWTALTLPNARLTLNGAVVPVQIAGSELRFYAPTVGDRWNSASAYVISIESDPSKRSPLLTSRTVSVPVAAADVAEIEATSTALDRGTWITNKVYEPMYPGDQGDHYYAAKLTRRKGTDPAQEFSTDLVTPANLNPANQLPIVSGTQVYTLSIVRVVAESYGPNLPIKVTVSGGAVAAKSASQNADFSSTVEKKIPFTFTATDAKNLKLTLEASTDARALVLEAIAYRRKVSLALNSRGAGFEGEAGQKTYRWSGVPKIGTSIVLWDVSNPAAPIALTGQADAGFVDTLAARRYVVAGSGLSHAPTVKGYSPISGTSLTPAHAIYVIPDSSYAAALQPLINLRQTQNCRPNVKCVVTVVDATRIYDRYSNGNIAPEAIRLFLRDAYTKFAAQQTGSPRLMSVGLVGDGTWDPKNFEAKQSNPALIPPYMVEKLDPSFGEAPCERCYAQYLGYNGVLCANPHTCDDKNGLPRAFSPEVSIGRLPIKNVTELQALVTKTVAYETATDNSPWRGRVIYIADNYMKGEPGPTPVPDGAGDFAATLDRIRAINPNAASSYSAARVYYDPFPGAQTPSKYGQPWRFSDPKSAWEQVIANLNGGASHVVYYGHATPWTMARYDLPTAWRFALIENTDAAFITNGNKVYVQLSATCLAAQFARPGDAGMTIDEQFMLDRDGGSVAAWGPAGYGIPTAHDRLLKGYFTKLFSTSATQTLATLTEAGYLELSLNTLGHYDMLRTFNLLGDPLMRVRMGPALYPNYMPVLRRNAR